MTKFPRRDQGGMNRWVEEGGRRGGVPVGLFVGQRFRDLQALVLLCVCVCAIVCVCYSVCEGRVIEPPFIQYLPTKPEQSCELCLLGTKCLSSSLSFFLFPLSPHSSLCLSLLATRRHIKMLARTKSHKHTPPHVSMTSEDNTLVYINSLTLLTWSWPYNKSSHCRLIACVMRTSFMSQMKSRSP